jgi:hypothetical protein
VGQKVRRRCGGARGCGDPRNLRNFNAKEFSDKLFGHSLRALNSIPLLQRYEEYNLSKLPSFLIYLRFFSLLCVSLRFFAFLCVSFHGLYVLAKTNAFHGRYNCHALKVTGLINIEFNS